MKHISTPRSHNVRLSEGRHCRHSNDVVPRWMRTRTGRSHVVMTSRSECQSGCNKAGHWTSMSNVGGTDRNIRREGCLSPSGKCNLHGTHTALMMDASDFIQALHHQRLTGLLRLGAPFTSPKRRRYGDRKFNQLCRAMHQMRSLVTNLQKKTCSNAVWKYDCWTHRNTIDQTCITATTA